MILLLQQFTLRSNFNQFSSEQKQGTNVKDVKQITKDHFLQKKKKEEEKTGKTKYLIQSLNITLEVLLSLKWRQRFLKVFLAFSQRGNTLTKSQRYSRKSSLSSNVSLALESHFLHKNFLLPFRVLPSLLSFKEGYFVIGETVIVTASSHLLSFWALHAACVFE